MTPETLPTPKFAIGDVVQLKSGGPLMTVGERNLTFDTVLAKWFDESSLCESWFHYLTLTKVEVCNAPL